MEKILVLMLLVISAIVSACSGDSSSDPQPVQVAFHDIPYQTEKHLRIGYTLKTWEYEKENLELQKIIILDHDTKAELSVIEKANLPKIYKDPLAANQYMVWDKLTNYYLSLQLPVPLGKAPPKTVSHRFVFRDTRSSTEKTVEGAQFSPRTNETPIAIASPLKGKNLVFINQSTMAYHFYVAFFTKGGIFNSERYAFDSLQFNDGLSAYFTGDPAKNTSYYNYGSTIYAVADGVVIQTENSQPENSGNAHDVVLRSMLEYAGNFVVLDIGGGRYAFYAHCIPGSVSVRVGDRVKEGDPIARIGNSGNSDAPHLHFQITDGPDFFLSKGLPFVLKKYTIIGDVTDAPVMLPQRSVINSMMEENTVFTVD